MTWYQKIIEHLSTGPHFIGLLLYISGAITMTLVQVRNGYDFKVGLKGKNGLWEAPEITVYLWLWLFPHFVMSITFLDFRPPDMVYYFMGAILLFALTGRWGIEYVLTRGKTEITSVKQKTEIQQTITQQQNDGSNQSEATSG